MQLPVPESCPILHAFMPDLMISLSFFIQLYELSNDPKRKEFLDDLFSFMQKRGK